MTTETPFEIFLASAPGHEATLAAELRASRFKSPRHLKGGVAFDGTWPDVWRANLMIRGANRVLARIAQFRAMHLAQLDKRAHRVPWATILRPDVPVRVEAVCRQSRIYHSGAAQERIEKAIKDELGVPITEGAPITIKVRIEDDLCDIAVDTSGELLHKRGHKEAVNKAPMRETMASLFLRDAGFTGREPVLDPMCGSGTFILEAADWAAGLAPGRSRSFAFEHLASFDPKAWHALRASLLTPTPPPEGLRFYGSDRDAGAVAMSISNAERGGVSAWTEFREQTVSALTRPQGPAGLVIANPPYGTRLGDTKELEPLYRALGQKLLADFQGWRAAIITTDPALARATGLPFGPALPPVLHGGLRVALFLTEPLP